MEQESPSNGWEVARGFGAFAIHFFALGALLVPFIFVVPAHEIAFQQMGVDLSPQVRFLIGKSHFILQFWYAVILIFVLFDILLIAAIVRCGWWKALTLLNYAALVGCIVLVLLVCTTITVPLQ